MTYSEILEVLEKKLGSYQKMGEKAYKPGLDRIQSFCNSIGNPELKFPTIHVGGTNGKGTVSHLIASALIQNGYQVGIHSSPHYFDYRERTKINNDWIDEVFIQSFFLKHQNQIEDFQLSFFEFSIALAFQYFYEKKVDVAIIEVGLGGRLDASNIIQPLLSIITHIDWDHMHILGNSLQEIAAEKSGIIKQGGICLIGRNQEQTKEVFIDQAKKENASLFYADDVVELLQINKQFPLLQLTFQIEGKTIELESDLGADYQIENIKTAWAALHLLQDKIQLNLDKCRSAFTELYKKTRYIGRCQIVQKQPLLIVDSAHNLEGCTEIIELTKVLTYKKLRIILGFASDKKVDEIFSLLPKNAMYYLTKANIDRAMSLAVLESHARRENLNYSSFEIVLEAVEKAKAEAEPSDLILVFGSIFLLSDLKTIILASDNLEA